MRCSKTQFFIGRSFVKKKAKILSSFYDYEVFFSDIFQFRLDDRSWVYCCFIIKRKTRQILSFAYSWGMRAELVETTISRIDLVDDLSDSELIFHSDQGKQYGAKLTIQACLEKHFTQSMSRAGTPTDNPMAERFVQTFKLAVVERYSFQTIGEFKEATTKWLNFYNNLRPHDSLKGFSPNKFAVNEGLQSVSYLSPIFV
ncbi:MAG: transposase [Candidatus Pacebacteria bacterium]|nr:transposase [Candidatus Paceibacterota bacterium]